MSFTTHVCTLHSTGYHPKDIPPSQQKSYWKYPVGDILCITLYILLRPTVHRTFITLYRISPTGHTTQYPVCDILWITKYILWTTIYILWVLDVHRI